MKIKLMFVCTWMHREIVRLHRVTHLLRGFDRVAPVGSARARTFVAISMEGLWALSMSSIGTLNGLVASVFTQGSLPWNVQALFSCQCAKNVYRIPFFPAQEKVEMPESYKLKKRQPY